jgi:homoserine O-acetyltransferase
MSILPLGSTHNTRHNPFMKYEHHQNPDGSTTCRIDQDFHFERGGSIRPLELVYEAYGQLSPNKDNVIVILHGLSPSQHVHSTPENPVPGWWEGMIGPGLALDTNRYFILCINNLGSPYGSSSPASLNPATGQAYGLDFPCYTLADIAKSQSWLLQCLGIEQVYALIGNSLGGMIGLEWVIAFPDSVQRFMSTSASYKAYPANIANRAIQRDIILQDPAYQNGRYTESPLPGLVLARKLGHFTYRNPDDLNEKFKTQVKDSPTEPSDVEAYLDYNGKKFASQFDPNCYLYCLTAMDLFDVSRTYHSAQAAFSRIRAQCLVISVDSDILFTPSQQHELAAQLATYDVPYQLIQHHSPYGHDTFLVEVTQYGNFIRNFLAT